MNLFRKKKVLNYIELETLHHLLSILYDESKPKQTDFNDALHLRMRLKEILE